MKLPKLPKIVVEDETKVITLICCLLENLGELTEPLLLEIITLHDTVSQFKLYDALTIIENKHLASITPKGYAITADGRTWLSQFENSLPVSLRRKLIEAGKETVRLFKLKKAVKWSILREDEDWVFYACFLNEMNGSRIMEVKIYAKTEEDAFKAQENFLSNPAMILSNTIGYFIG